MAFSGRLTFVKEAFTGETGGGVFVDVLVLDDDTVLAIGCDGISFYRNLEHYHDNAADSVFDFERVEPELVVYADEMKEFTLARMGETHHTLRITVISR